MRTADFDFDLPADRIALRPLAERDASRLLVVNRQERHWTHHAAFGEILNYLRPGDLLVLNNSRVIPARLFGTKSPSGGNVEVLLLAPLRPTDWWVLLRPGKRVRTGTQLVFHARTTDRTLEATVLAKNEEGHYLLNFAGEEHLLDLLEEFGEIPLPPYLARPVEAADRERYQTVYAQSKGSVAAPTAGLHFTEGLIAQAAQQGLSVAYVTLHVGLGTFAPVKSEDLAGHPMHEERFTLPAETVHRIEAARAASARVVAVGTTTVRVLESVAASHHGRLVPVSEGQTRIFIYPPYRFRVVDGLITNFHLPKSTLLMLVSAFAAPDRTDGRDLVLAAYAEAIRERYRFFSYGDAMLLL